MPDGHRARVITHALRLAKVSGAVLHVVHVVEFPHIQGPAITKVVAKQLALRARSIAQARLNESITVLRVDHQTIRFPFQEPVILSVGPAAPEAIPPARQ